MEEVCSFHAMINPVNCRLLPDKWCSSTPSPPALCAAAAPLGLDAAWEQDHLVEPLKKWFAVCLTAHSCITVRFKTKQGVENHRMSGGAHKPNRTLTWGYFGLVAHDPNGPSVHPGKSNHNVPGIGRHDLEEFPLIHNLRRGEAGRARMRPDRGA